MTAQEAIECTDHLSIACQMVIDHHCEVGQCCHKQITQMKRVVNFNRIDQPEGQRHKVLDQVPLGGMINSCTPNQGAGDADIGTSTETTLFGTGGSLQRLLLYLNGEETLSEWRSEAQYNTDIEFFGSLLKTRSGPFSATAEMEAPDWPELLGGRKIEEVAGGTPDLIDAVVKDLMKACSKIRDKIHRGGVGLGQAETRFLKEIARRSVLTSEEITAGALGPDGDPEENQDTRITRYQDEKVAAKRRKAIAEAQADMYHRLKAEEEGADIAREEEKEAEAAASAAASATSSAAAASSSSSSSSLEEKRIPGLKNENPGDHTSDWGAHTSSDSWKLGAFDKHAAHERHAHFDYTR